MKRTVRLTFLCILIFCTIFGLSSNYVKAAEQNIRVGLVSNYKNKSEITIKNTSVVLGYSMNYSYIKEETFSSTNGFTLKPATGFYYILNKTYTTYLDAKQVATKLSSMGITAYPVVCFQKTWKVYIGGSNNQSTVKNQYDTIKGKFGYTYQGIISDNKHRIMVTGSDGSFLIDLLEDKKAYPQFSTNTKNSKNVSVINLGVRSYRGRIEIGRYGNNTLTAVNVVPIESYLYGVVPCEMVSTWPMEALKAQAVCARSYAVKNAGYHSASNVTKGYTMVDTTSSQVYKGYNSETMRTNQAVNETKGKTLCFLNQVITTYYYSTSGGSTENVEDVWTSAKPYLKAVPDLYELEPEKKPWIVKYTKSEIAAKLKARGINIGALTSIYPDITTSSGRIYSLKMKGTVSSTVLQKSTISSIFGLPSTKFKLIQSDNKPDTVSALSSSKTATVQIKNSYIINGNHQVTKASSSLEQYIVMSADNMTNFPREAPTSSDTIYFAGQGYGHGVGMSQSGAKGMANAGYTYDEILEHYYPGTRVQ